MGGGTSAYDPDFYDGPTTVYVNTMIRSISKIDDYKMVREDNTAARTSEDPPPSTWTS